MLDASSSHTATLAAALALVVACSSNGDDPTTVNDGPSDAGMTVVHTDEVLALVAQNFSGIYRVDGYTSNTLTCDAEGLSALETLSASALRIVGMEWNTMPVVETCLCGNTVEECAHWQASLDQGAVVPCLLQFLATDYVSDVLLTGELRDGGTLENGVCRDATFQSTSFAKLDAERLRIESRRHQRDVAPDSSSGACPQSGANVVESAPCNGYEVVEATKIAPLP